MSLYVVSGVFGLFQGGIVPSYAMIVREHFPAREAGTRVGLALSATLAGMALGGWMSGAIFDATGSYQAAILNGLAVERAEPADRGLAAASRAAAAAAGGGSRWPERRRRRYRARRRRAMLGVEERFKAPPSCRTRPLPAFRSPGSSTRARSR